MRSLIVTLCLMVASVLLVLAVAPAQVERATNVVLPHAPWPIGERAARLHGTLRIADWRAGSLLWNRDLTQRSEVGHADLPRLREGNVTLQVFTAAARFPRGPEHVESAKEGDPLMLLAVAQGWPMRSWISLPERALHQADRLRGFAEAAPDDLVLVTDRDGLTAALAAREDGPAPMIGLLAVEGLHVLAGDAANLERLWNAGFRIFGLQHVSDRAFGGSLPDEPEGGLSAFGRAIVAEIEARGGIIDLAHASPEVVRDVLAMTARPPIVSHTGLQGACPSPRNMPDALVAAIAERGGLIGIGYGAGAVCDPGPASIAATFGYGRELLGADALSLGSDFDGATTVAFDASELAVLTQSLLVAGYSEEAIGDVMGENTLRFLVRWLP